MKVFPKIVLLSALLLAFVKADLDDNYLPEVDYGSDLGEFTPRSLNEDDAQGAGLTTATETEDPLNAISSPVDAETVSDLAELNTETDNGLVNLNTGSEAEHNQNYVKISSDLKAYEDAYKACIDNLSDNDFSQEAVEKCVGVNYQFVYDDIDYEKRKILARADSSIRTAMITICYTAAGADLVMDNACDLIQKDALDLMWNEMNFEIVIEYHREKYVFVHAKLPENIFTQVINKFKDIYSGLSQLIEELYSHRDITIMRIKRSVDERTAVLTEKFKGELGHQIPPIKQELIDQMHGDNQGPYADYQDHHQSWIQTLTNAIGPAQPEEYYDEEYYDDGYGDEYGDQYGDQYDGELQISPWFRNRHLRKAQPLNAPAVKKQAVIHPVAHPVTKVAQQPHVIHRINRAVKPPIHRVNKIVVPAHRIAVRKQPNFRRMRVIRRAPLSNASVVHP